MNQSERIAELESQVPHLQAQVLACQTRNAELQHAICVLVEAGQGNPGVVALAEVLLAVMAEKPPQVPGETWQRQFTLLAGEIVAKNHEILALREDIENLQQLSTTDPLTGLMNRRGMEAEFAREFTTLARSLAHPFDDIGERRVLPTVALLALDIDYFKRINDAYGHQAGDQVLICLAHILSEEMSRASDLVARMGGEEFFVVLPAVSPEQAWAQSEAFRKRVASHPFLLHSSEGGEPVAIPMTVSIGVAAIEVSDEPRHPKDAWGELYTSADKALYQAKASGRNRVVRAGARGG